MSLPQPAARSIFGDVTFWIKRVVFNSLVVSHPYEAHNLQRHIEHDDHKISTLGLKQSETISSSDDDERPSKRAKMSNETIKPYDGSRTASSDQLRTEKDLYGSERSSKSTLLLRKSHPTQCDDPQRINELGEKVIKDAFMSRNPMDIEEENQDGDDDGIISADEIWYEAEEWHEESCNDGGIFSTVSISKSTQKEKTPPPIIDDQQRIIDDVNKRNTGMLSPRTEAKKETNMIEKEGRAVAGKNAPPSPPIRSYTQPTVATSVNLKYRKKEEGNPPPAVHISPGGSCSPPAVATAASPLIANDVTGPVPLTITPPAAILVPAVTRLVSGDRSNAAIDDDSGDKEEDRKLPARCKDEVQKKGDTTPHLLNIRISSYRRKRKQVATKSVQKQSSNIMVNGTAGAAAASSVAGTASYVGAKDPSAAVGAMNSTVSKLTLHRQRKTAARKSAPGFRGVPSLRRNFLAESLARERIFDITKLQLFPHEILLLICSYYQGDFSVLSNLSRTCSGFHTVLKENDHLWKISDPEHEYFTSFEVKNRTYKTWHWSDESSDDDSDGGGDDDHDDLNNRRSSGGAARGNGRVVKFPKRERITVVTCREMAGRINRVKALQYEQRNPHGASAVLDELGKEEFESFLRALFRNVHFRWRYRFHDDDAIMAYALLLEANVVHVCEKLLKLHVNTSMYAFYEHPFSPPCDSTYRTLVDVQLQDVLKDAFDELFWSRDDLAHPMYLDDQVLKSKYYRAIRRMAYSGGLCEIDGSLANNIWMLFMAFGMKIMSKIRAAYDETPEEDAFVITKSMIEQRVKALGLPYQVAYVHTLDNDENEDDEVISWSPSSEIDDDDEDEALILESDDEDSQGS